MEKCFACDRKLSEYQTPKRVDTRDGQTVFVGPECFKEILKSGGQGYQPPKGGPRLYLMDCERCEGSGVEWHGPCDQITDSSTCVCQVEDREGMDK